MVSESMLAPIAMAPVKSPWIAEGRVHIQGHTISARNIALDPQLYPLDAIPSKVHDNCIQAITAKSFFEEILPPCSAYQLAGETGW